MKVRLVDSDYWAEVTNFGNKFVHIPTEYVRNYERLLTGGIWAQVDMRFEYDEETKGKHPFWIDKLAPIQIATMLVKTTINGRGVSAPVPPQVKDVAPQQKALLLSLASDVLASGG